MTELNRTEGASVSKFIFKEIQSCIHCPVILEPKKIKSVTVSIFSLILALGTSRPGVVLLTAALRKCPMASTGDKFQKQLTFRKRTAKGKLSSQPLEKKKKKE